MVLESFEIIAVIGIACEIFGFILMIKYYGKKPTENNWKKWKTKHLINKGFERWEEKDVAYIEMLIHQREQRTQFIEVLKFIGIIKQSIFH